MHVIEGKLLLLLAVRGDGGSDVSHLLSKSR